MHALVHSVLTSAGVTSVQDDAGSRDRGVDFVVWSDSLRGSFGNPVLIEVKGYLERAQFQSAYYRLTKWTVIEIRRRSPSVSEKARSGIQRNQRWNPLVL